MENIPKDVIDPFYRYRRERVKIMTARANTTVITNFAVVCQQIERPQEHVAKYIKACAAASATVKNGVLVVKGEHTATSLDNCVEDYIGVYVLCGVCRNPETDFDAKTASKQCRACGATT